MIRNEDTYCVVYHKIVRELGAWEAIVYSTIVALLRKTDGIGEVSNQTLMDMCGLPLASLKRYINTLIKNEYIEKKGGNGRGNISIYYITKKGLNLNTLKQKKGAQIDTEKGSKMNEKGLNLDTINKGIIKENKESGGDTRETRSHTLSTTTTQILEDMKDFNLFWDLYPGDPEWTQEKESCERVWSLINPEWQDKLITQLQDGKRWRPIDKTNPDRNNPIWYLRNYQGQDVQGELPYLRQGSAKFIKWREDNTKNGKRMCLIQYEGKVANCLYDDLQTMIAAGAKVFDDDWK